MPSTKEAVKILLKHQETMSTWQGVNEAETRVIRDIEEAISVVVDALQKAKLV